VIVTWSRPDYVRNCLAHLAQLEPLPSEIIVVDASEDDQTAQVVAEFPAVRRIPFRDGAGHMTRARNYGLAATNGDIVAFIDDDANVRSEWLTNLQATFEDPSIAAVAGRTCDGVPGEEIADPSKIGRVLPDGQLTGNFAADTGRVIDIDHGIGANMSFRRSTLAELGGLRDDFPGSALREDTDVFLRVRALGGRAVFAPGAVVDHVGAPHVRGQRFDWRYGFWARHNHALLLARNYGLTSQVFRRWLGGELVRAKPASLRPRMMARGAIQTAALAAGVLTSVIKGRRGPRDPRRHDATGLAVRRALLADLSPELPDSRTAPTD
jgi:GT2 family glycosyltransferase